MIGTVEHCLKCTIETVRLAETKGGDPPTDAELVRTSFVEHTVTVARLANSNFTIDAVFSVEAIFLFVDWAAPALPRRIYLLRSPLL